MYHMTYKSVFDPVVFRVMMAIPSMTPLCTVTGYDDFMNKSLLTASLKLLMLILIPLIAMYSICRQVRNYYCDMYSVRT